MRPDADYILARYRNKRSERSFMRRRVPVLARSGTRPAGVEFAKGRTLSAGVGFAKFEKR
jgi:hypothetical protein